MARQRRRPRGDLDNRFRIIGGEYRGRRLDFPNLPDLRPTPDRVRETLFNWLAPVVPGARCVDLFAGAGALGLEALSRGAAEVVFVDASDDALDAIRRHVMLLGCRDRARFAHGTAGRWLRQTGAAADVFFVDPPFARNLWEPLCTLIGELTPAAADAGSLVYLEHPADHPMTLPPGWVVARRSRAGRVGFQLVRTARE